MWGQINQIYFSEIHFLTYYKQGNIVLMGWSENLLNPLCGSPPPLMIRASANDFCETCHRCNSLFLKIKQMQSDIYL